MAALTKKNRPSERTKKKTYSELKKREEKTKKKKCPKVRKREDPSPSDISQPSYEGQKEG